MQTNLHANGMTKRYFQSNPEDREKEFFKNIPKELARKLRKLYEKDLIMFGYELDLDNYHGSCLLYTSPSPRD